MHGIPNTPEAEKGLVKVIRTDRGGELAGCKAFEDACNTHGYSVQKTATETSSQNGIAERPNQTLGNMLRSTMHGAGLHGKYWSDILLQVVYVKNKLPHSHFDYKSTPQTEFTGIRPNLKNLRIPGSLVTVKNQEDVQLELLTMHMTEFFFVMPIPWKIVYTLIAKLI